MTFDPGRVVGFTFGIVVGFSFGAAPNTAVTALGDDTLTTQMPLPLHPPAQRTSRKPLLSLGTSVTRVPAAKDAVHLPGHEIPPGLLPTVAPFPRTTTVRGVRPPGWGAAAATSVKALASTHETATRNRVRLAGCGHGELKEPSARGGRRAVRLTGRIIGRHPFQRLRGALWRAEHAGPDCART